MDYDFRVLRTEPAGGVEKPFPVTIACAATVLAAGGGVSVALDSWILALTSAVVVVVLWFRDQRVWSYLTGALVPLSGAFAFHVAGATIALCDVLAVVALCLFILNRVRVRGDSTFGIRRYLITPTSPVLILTLAYAGMAILSTVLFHSSSIPVWVSVAQRIEIVVLWVAFGAYAFVTSTLNHVLWGFASAAMMLSAMFMLSPGAAAVVGTQKNPAGGFIAAAIIVVLLARLSTSVRYLLLLVLGIGLICTGSRGALLGLVVAILVLLLIGRPRSRVAATVGVAAVFAIIALQWVVPDSLRERLLNRSAAGKYNTDIRGVFIDDAIMQWRVNEWAGVGIGQYRHQLGALDNVATNDPHNVFVLALVEGGWPLLLGFSVFIIGTFVWLLTRRPSPLVAAAIAVQVSTVVHAFYDVYWVRGTPVIGWILVGAVAAVSMMGRDTLVNHYRLVRTASMLDVTDPVARDRSAPAPARLLGKRVHP